MDDMQNRQLRNAEPMLDADGLADAPAMLAPTPAADDLPVWLREPVPAASRGAQVKRGLVIAGGSLAALALAFAGTLWLFEQDGDSPVELAAASAGAAAVPAPVAAAAPELPPLRPRSSPLPPLVLLAPAPDPAAKEGAPAAAVALAAPQPAGALKKIEKPAPVLATLSPRAPAAKPAVDKATPKAHAPRKIMLAKNSAVQPKAKSVAAVRKPLVAAKRAPAGSQAKARPRLLAAVSLPPARARAGLTHKCLPGELARECAARQ